MKRIDLLVEHIENIYQLLKTQMKAPCCCVNLASCRGETSSNQEEEGSLVQILKSIEKQMHLSNERIQPGPRVEDPQAQLEEWMSKQDVIDYLQISDRTYRRQVESGLLKPMNIGGGDFYFKSHLLEALQESRRRGRV